MTELAAKNVVMWTSDGYYRQMGGLAMGSKPAGPLENIWLSKYGPRIKNNAKVFERYVDDIIRSIQRQHQNEKLAEINKFHPN